MLDQADGADAKRLAPPTGRKTATSPAEGTGARGGQNPVPLCGVAIETAPDRCDRQLPARRGRLPSGTGGTVGEKHEPIDP